MTEADHIQKIRPLVEELIRNLERMPAPYEAHVGAKQCVEKFWQSIQPAPEPSAPIKPNEPTAPADGTSV